MKEAIVLLHGIWMRPIIMALMARRLTNLGYLVLQPDYASLRNTTPENADMLCQQIPDLLAPLPPIDTLHFVCHSLGGLVALHLLQHCTGLTPGRLVTLGTPVQGSQIATRIKRWPGSDIVLGKSFEQGLAGIETPDNLQHEWGMIAGTKAAGVGVVLGGFQGQKNDGTVAVSETLAEQQTAHITLPVTHTGMVFSDNVLTETACFLRSGKFSA